MTAQTKLESALESTLNIASGFIISLCVWLWVVAPMINAGIIHPGPIGDSIIITTIFTVTSWVRSYVWRRFFERRLHKAVHEFIAVKLKAVIAKFNKYWFL